jgi:WD40 repeat protein
MEIVNDPEPPEQVPSGSDHPTSNTNDALTPELYFLIANALSTGPLAHLGVEIARQASQRGLLPSRLDFQGRRHPLSLSELRRRHPHLGPDALALAASQLLQHRQQEDARAPWRKLTSILDPAVLPGPSALPSLPGFAAVPPRWALPPASSKHGGAGLLPPRLSLLKETAAAPFVPGTHIFTPATFAAKSDHHWTVRGHTNAAYCVVVDPTNRYIVTGSDDHLVKVWSTRTALLLRTCRGHSQEVTDLAVAPDGSLFASASMDGTIRVWMMDGRNEVKEENDDEDVFHLGTPVCVLQGHNSCVTFIEFCPTAPHVLVSSGFDGICRVWDARDGSAPPMILQCNQARPGATALNFSHDHDMRVTRHADRRYGGGGGDALGPSTGTHARAAAAGPSNQRRQQPAERGARRRTRRGSHDSDADFVPSDGGVDGEDRSEDDNEDLHHHHAVRGSGGDPVSLIDEQAHQEEEEEEHPAGEVQTAETPQLLTCGFSRDGRYVMAGSSDCCVYLWRLSVPEGETGTSTQQLKGPFSKGTPLGKERRRSWGQPHDWPEVEELIRLDGHRNDVYLLQFSHNGATLASGSKDGTVRLWRRPKRLRRSGRRPNWTLEATLACPVDEEAITLARQRRRTVPPPRVDQLAFTADDARIVVSFQDLAVHVFGVPSGKHLHALSKVHAEPIHVLMCHPFDPALAVSASYAGEVALLDVVQGKKLKGFDSRYSRPDGRPWPEGDSLPYVDGFMRPDGMSFVLTDAAGQLHCFG